MFCTFQIGNVLRATTACTFSDIWTSKSGRNKVCFVLLTWQCASRHNGVHSFDISTSKSGLNVLCFLHFDLEMCFAPQRRALFRHLNVKKWSEHSVFCTFWLGNVLRATTKQKFFISHLARWLRTCRFLRWLKIRGGLVDLGKSKSFWYVSWDYPGIPGKTP